MTTFYICRHGESENNKLGKFSGWVDTPLTPAGVANAEAVAAKLHGVPIDTIVSSDLGRAFTTAYIISRRIGYQDEIIRTAELREMNYGDFANKPYDHYPIMTPLQNAHFIVPGGESLEQMQVRVLQAVDDISRTFPNKTILLVGHDGTINAVRASFNTESIGIADQMHSPHDYLGSFEWHDGTVLPFTDPTHTGSRR